MTTIKQSLPLWLEYLAALHPKAIDLGLARMTTLAQALCLLEFDSKVITIGGTNGKGSVVKTLEQLYFKAGYSVAAYTSPHLLRFTERLQINGCELSEKVWVDAFTHIEQARGNVSLTFFEFTTLAALFICKQYQLDVILLEVGLGGRLDAVNVVESDLALVTSIDLDHVEWLGDNREAIGLEKAGIYREGKPAICADPNPPKTLVQVAREKKSKFYCYQQDYFAFCRGTSWEFCGLNKRYLGLGKPVLRLQNVAAGLMATELLEMPIPRSVVYEVMHTISLPGRYEKFNRGATYILDVAHNPQACTWLAEQIQSELTSQSHCIAILGMRRDKDYQRALRPLLPLVSTWYTATINTPQAQEGKILEKYLTGCGVKCYSSSSIAAALEVVSKGSKAPDIVLVFGSFHTVAEAKGWLASHQ